MNDSVSEGKFLSEQFGVAGPPAARPLAVIEAELDLLEKDTRQKERALISNYIEVGRRLEEVKAQLAHGEWDPWLESRGYPQAKAVKLMKVARTYGKEQQSLFGGEAKSQAFEDLGFHKLVQLLAIEDDGEREQFAIENDVAGMSTRELERALRERDEARETAAAAQDEAQGTQRENERLREELAGQAQVYQAKLISAEIEARAAQEKAAANVQRLQDALSEANTSVQASEAEHARLLQELEELRSRPVEVAVGVDEEAVEAARKAAVAEMAVEVDKSREAAEQANAARKRAEDDLAAAQKELAELKAKEPQARELTQEEKDALTTDAVERARSEALERIKDLEKQLDEADPDMAALNVLFTSWQETYWKMQEIIDRIEHKDSDKAGRFQDAIRSTAGEMAAR